MTDQVIFDTSSPALGLTGYIVIGVVLLVCGCVIFFWKRNPKQGKIGLIVILFVTFYTAFVLFYSYFHEIKYLYNAYTAGDYQVVEGEIYDYTPLNVEEGIKYDTFFVDGIEFDTGKMFSFGYSLMQSEGSPLKNGMKVRIYYIFYKYTNVMMKIEVLKE